MKYLNYINIQILLLILAANTSAQEKFNTELIHQSIEQSKTALITANVYVNQYPSKKEQFYSSWCEGQIEFTNGTISEVCKLRYNTWLDELIWLRESDFKSGVVIKNTLKTFTLNTINNDTIKFTKLDVPNGLSTTNTFMEVLTEGSFNFLCHRKAIYNKTTDNFSIKNSYYLKQNNELVKILLNKRSLSKSLSAEHFNKLKQILKENNLSIKNEYELAKGFKLLSL